MQFKHPEILYFLLALIIPILIHLFQLRRFKKHYFTNVKLLQKLQTQTRKSSQIKKWLLLATRMLLFAALILAFAQPFFTEKSTSSPKELLILLDNSFSMQAQGKQGELLQRSAQELLENLPKNSKFSLLTADDAFWDTDVEAVEKQLIQINYTAQPFQVEGLLNKARNKKKNQRLDVLVISDVYPDFKPAAWVDQVSYVPATPERRENISVEKVEIIKRSNAFYTLDVTTRGYGIKEARKVHLKLMEGEQLVASTQVEISGKEVHTSLEIPKKPFAGYVSIGDDNLAFDDRFYFAILPENKPQIAVFDTRDHVGFFNAIYPPQEFDLKFYNGGFDQVDLKSLDVLVLNELEQFSETTVLKIKEFYSRGGVVVFIPNTEAGVLAQNKLLYPLGGIRLMDVQDLEKQVVHINFEHPLYAGVFEKKVVNFQYPTVQKSFKIQGVSAPILKFADQQPFLTHLSNRVGHLYLFTAALDKDNTNFKASPLIVPTLHKMGVSQAGNAVQSITMGTSTELLLKTRLNANEVVHVVGAGQDFIPFQQGLQERVQLQFSDLPTTAGLYELGIGSRKLQALGFNYNREESDITKQNNTTLDQVETIQSIESGIDQLIHLQQDSLLWKYLMALALLFFILELLIQKFVK